MSDPYEISGQSGAVDEDEKVNEDTSSIKKAKRLRKGYKTAATRLINKASGKEVR